MPTAAMTSATDHARFTTGQSWHANAKKFKKVRKLGESGTPVYWRVLERDSDNVETVTEPFVFYLP